MAFSVELILSSRRDSGSLIISANLGRTSAHVPVNMFDVDDNTRGSRWLDRRRQDVSSNDISQQYKCHLGMHTSKGRPSVHRQGTTTVRCSLSYSSIFVGNAFDYRPQEILLVLDARGSSKFDDVIKHAQPPLLVRPGLIGALRSKEESRIRYETSAMACGHYIDDD